MKIALTSALVAIMLTGCAAGSNFKPMTAEGASCKADCAKDMANCRGSSYTCDRAASTCMSACADLDAIKSKQTR